MQGKPLDASGFAGAGVWGVGFGQVPAGAGGAAKHPRAAPGKCRQEVQEVRRGWYLSRALHFVANADSLPLGVHVLPAQRQHFAGSCAGQQQRLQVGRYDGALQLLHGGEPAGQLAALQYVGLGARFAQCFARPFGLGRVGGW